LWRAGPELTADECRQLKNIAREVLYQLHDKLQAVEWQKNPRSSNQVFITIRRVLGQLLTAYTTQVMQKRVDSLYAYVLGAFASGSQAAQSALT